MAPSILNDVYRMADRLAPLRRVAKAFVVLRVENCNLKVPESCAPSDRVPPVFHTAVAFDTEGCTYRLTTGN